ncbi:alginate O-acetyltransferase [Geomonas silvestris]|uniref:Alginate O-acetyltransferase n=1 Tax=Geomonas silvestris TaxID=2740184 RepID=A0A6V8MKU8_9BACT|nr:MBOAT family O-acyltransferase [Geomonas silvestris]GFO60602.1 alginate O-acetyltransferase [Geomonas silvestris]
MPFNSLSYFLFLPVVYLCWYLSGEWVRPWILLAASLVFYAALRVPYLVAALLLVSLTSFAFARALGQSVSPGRRKLLFCCGIATELAILAGLKYLPLLGGVLQLAKAFGQRSPGLTELTPLVSIGASYFTFQALSYLIDVYLELEEPEPHLGYYTLYLAFFPKLLQGPIERAADLIPQLKAHPPFSYDNLRFGLLLFCWGLFKKVVVADRLALFVDPVYSDPRSYTGLPLLVATYCYALQIYLDFSGYTDMSLGSARIFNIELTQNFNSPYLARSVAEFWRRWHISFSRWILDYVFRPLQMRWRDRKNAGTAAALLAAFLVSGLWHGAKWGFLIWGALHGLYLAASVYYKPYQKRLHKALGVEKSRLLHLWQVLVTFHLVSFAWIFFRAATLEDALYVVRHLASGPGGLWSGFLLAQGRFDPLVLVLCLGLLLWCKKSELQLSRMPTALRWAVYYALVLAIFLFQVPASTFIYFQF